MLLDMLTHLQMDLHNLLLYQVNGQFQVGEEFFINGVTANRSITEVEDYGIEDVKQIVSNDMTNYPFTADPVLNLGHFLMLLLQLSTL